MTAIDPLSPEALAQVPEVFLALKALSEPRAHSHLTNAVAKPGCVDCKPQFDAIAALRDALLKASGDGRIILGYIEDVRALKEVIGEAHQAMKQICEEEAEDEGIVYVCCNEHGDPEIEAATLGEAISQLWKWFAAYQSMMEKEVDGLRAWTLAALRAANVERNAHWDPDGKLSLSFRGNELAGEVGEVCNVVKKLERERLGLRGSRDTVDHLAEELADVVICADLIGMAAGVDLERAVASKFNATSEKLGLPTRMKEAR